MEEELNPEAMVLFPEGTEIFSPTEDNEITIKFPTPEDAIIFYEFLRSFNSGEVRLEISTS
jgi:hypothetical protein